jgi:hypothetical protein
MASIFRNNKIRFAFATILELLRQHVDDFKTVCHCMAGAFLTVYCNYGLPMRCAAIVNSFPIRLSSVRVKLVR